MGESVSKKGKEMKKNIILTVVLVLIILGLVYFFFLKNDEKEIVYQEPTPVFFDSSLLDEKDIVVKITDDGFVPSNIKIKKGGKISFVNESSTFSWPASDPHPTHTEYSLFDAELPMKKGQAWSFVFNDTGEFKFHDHLDPIKRGIVYVSP